MLDLAGIAMPSPLRCGTGDDWSESGGPQDDKISSTMEFVTFRGLLFSVWLLLVSY